MIIIFNLSAFNIKLDIKKKKLSILLLISIWNQCRYIILNLRPGLYTHYTAYSVVFSVELKIQLVYIRIAIRVHDRCNSVIRFVFIRTGKRRSAHVLVGEVIKT